MAVKQWESMLRALQQTWSMAICSWKQNAQEKAEGNRKSVSRQTFYLRWWNPARRRSDGKAEFRQFSISPSNDPGYLVYQAMSCEGQETADGGIVPAKGMPSRRTITVKVADVYTKALGVNILLDWAAYKTLSLFSNLLKSKSEVNLMDNNCIPEDTLVATLKKRLLSIVQKIICVLFLPVLFLARVPIRQKLLHQFRKRSSLHQ